jgi:peptide deformylase
VAASDTQDTARRVAAQRQVRQYPDPILRERAREVETFDGDLEALAERMLRLMDDAHGAGLAAPQIGLLRRLFVYRGPDDEVGHVLVNPVIEREGEETAVEGEGCLSLEVLLRADHQVPVERHLKVHLRARDATGASIELDLEGHEARVVQHELDHLDGVLIIDRTTREDRKEAMRILREALG